MNEGQRQAMLEADRFATRIVLASPLLAEACRAIVGLETPASANWSSGDDRPLRLESLVRSVLERIVSK